MPTPTLEEIRNALHATSKRLNIPAYLVGGVVRDQLLKRPNKDIDIVITDGDPQLFLSALGELLHIDQKPIVVGQFQVATTSYQGLNIEVVRARNEQYLPLSRKPTVAPGTLEDDIWRRDFTINTLAQTPTGEILDITNMGLADLHAKVLRTPLAPEVTFSEDPLRGWRLARFVSTLNFVVDPKPSLGSKPLAKGLLSSAGSVSRVSSCVF